MARNIVNNQNYLKKSTIAELHKNCQLSINLFNHQQMKKTILKGKMGGFVNDAIMREKAN